MKDFFTKKYNGVAGRILDAWATDNINREIGELYEKHVFGQESLDVKEILNEYHSEKTGGAIRYSNDLKSTHSSGKIFKEKSD
jgi:hypothetical protein